MVFFTLFIVLPTEEVCTLRGIPSGVTVNEIKSRLEVSAGLPSQLYHLSSRRQQELNDDYILELHHNVWNGFQYRAEVKVSWQPLFAAVVKEDVDWLLRNGRVCVTSGDNNNNNNNGGTHILERGCVALYLASWLGSSKICQSLLSAGVNPNGATRNNRTPLFAAVARDNVQVVSILLNHGAKLYVKDINGDTPLDTARRNAAKQCVQIILSARSTSVYNLKAGDKDVSAETDISFCPFARNVGHENISSVEFPKQRPFTTRERANIGCDYKVKFKPNMSASRRSVTFNVDKVHSLPSRSYSTLLPDVPMPTSNKCLPSSKCVSFRAHRPRGTRIPELSLLTVKALPSSAPGGRWNKINDVVTWNGPTIALECFHARSVLGKQNSDPRFGHSDNDLYSAVETETSDVAENEELGTGACNPTIAYDEQSYGARDIDFNTHALSHRIARSEKRGVAKEIDIDTSALNPTTTQHEQSGDAKNLDFRTSESELATVKSEQNGGVKDIYFCTSRPDLANAESEQSGSAKDIDFHISESDLATAESEQIGVDQKVDRGPLNLTTLENEQSDRVKKIELGTSASNSTIAQYEANGNVDDIDFNTLALNLILAESEQHNCAKKIDYGALPTNLTTAEPEQNEDAKKINPSALALNLTTAEQSHDAKSRECDTPSPKLASEVTNSAAVPPTDKNVHNADISERNVGNASYVRGDSKNSTSCNSVKDARPMTANFSVFGNQNAKYKSTGALKTAVRQITLAEQRKRIMSASHRNK